MGPQWRARGKKCGGWLRGQLNECGFRMTAPREAILNALNQMTNHPSTEEIYHKLHKQYPRIGLTTVYRTLELLVRMGLVHKFDFGDGRARFERIDEVSAADHHHHLVCTSCGKIVNYTEFIDEELQFLKRAEAGLSKKYNFEINNHLLQFYGVCAQCHKKG